MDHASLTALARRCFVSQAATLEGRGDAKTGFTISASAPGIHGKSQVLVANHHRGLLMLEVALAAGAGDIATLGLESHRELSLRLRAALARAERAEAKLDAIANLIGANHG